MPALAAPGAALYYEVRGAGPTLLLMPGGGGDADSLAALADRLAADFQVVTFDRRGLSRSTQDDPGEDPGIGGHADDAARVLAAVTGEPALVFGSSLGAVIGLDLLLRHPDRVRLLVAHEPPLPQFLPAAERAESRGIQAEMEQSGPQWREVAAALAMDHSDTEPDVVAEPPGPRDFANQRLFLDRDAPAVHRYRLAVEAIRSAADRIIPAAGEKSAHAFPHRCALGLGAELGIPVDIVPGDHVGPMTRPTGFAAGLREIFTR
ncbi:alpha/beta fold hydrolase [Actinokineospora inagensis]|uniref:alpha/beta fold hydrolase n=1 Tax=Actinokineospora inagensis TaxID=103730 RepID=UPI0004112AFD|nr:alpha/beta hydrolase [Actinokineospora inagensis]